MSQPIAKIFEPRTRKLLSSCPCANLDTAIAVAKAQPLACVINERGLLACYRNGAILSDEECAELFK